MENKKNKVVETLSQVTMAPAISKPTTPLILSRYARNFSKLNRGLAATFLNLPIAATVVEFNLPGDGGLISSSSDVFRTAFCHSGIFSSFDAWFPLVDFLLESTGVLWLTSSFFLLGTSLSFPLCELFFLLKKVKPLKFPEPESFVSRVFLPLLLCKSSIPELSLLDSSRSSLCIQALTTTIINLNELKIY